ncbi:MAG TPA: isoprenylcysteine carboxylmethyltransferase family protein [Terracidiphilus sp.]|nr:isoprenylcysteine carboxylmethyltransferase family protein [Terracidiphilus sp.]
MPDTVAASQYSLTSQDSLDSPAKQHPGRPTAPVGPHLSLGVRIAARVVIILPSILGLLLLTAGKWRFWQAWAWVCSSILPAAVMFVILARYAPDVMERRLQSKEEVAVQRNLIRFLMPAFFIAFCMPGLDHRFGWSQRLLGAVPAWLSIVADGVVLAGVLFAFWVIVVNRFASRTIRVEAGQTVISTGPYRWVRHPMYSGSILIWIATPLALGSYVALPAFVALIPFYVVRLLNEEKVMTVELAGYTEYCVRTRYRLVPFVW